MKYCSNTYGPQRIDPNNCRSPGFSLVPPAEARVFHFSRWIGTEVCSDVFSSLMIKLNFGDSNYFSRLTFVVLTFLSASAILVFTANWQMLAW